MASENYFDDGPAQQPPPTGGSSEAGNSPKEGGPTALLPKSILAGKDFKPGDEVVLKIDAIHGDSVQVSYAPEKGEGEEEYEGDKEQEAPAEEQPPPDQGGAGNVGDPEMASMMG